MSKSEPIVLVVNGVRSTVTAAANTPLLYVLRNDLALKGTRFGCGDGLCGACTVLVDGKARTACDIPLWEAAGKEIETIDSDGNDDDRAAIITEMIEGQAGQCGYCLAGILMRAKALLAQTPRPGRAEIAAALDDHLCRCGAHNRIMRAIEQAGANVAQEARS